jgi:hypothetical protein|tara:strand:+ start:725 stop:994 length:270 start_codon:yes stop_codon:yes gene_type:complete
LSCERLGQRLCSRARGRAISSQNPTDRKTTLQKREKRGVNRECGEKRAISTRIDVKKSATFKKETRSREKEKEKEKERILKSTQKKKRV